MKITHSLVAGVSVAAVLLGGYHVVKESQPKPAPVKHAVQEPQTKLVPAPAPKPTTPAPAATTAPKPTTAPVTPAPAATAPTKPVTK